MNEKPPKIHILIGCQKRAQNNVFLFEKSLKSPFCATTPNFMHTSEIYRTAPKRENPAGPRSESPRDAKTSLGLAQNRPETRKPRWASSFWLLRGFVFRKRGFVFKIRALKQTTGIQTCLIYVLWRILFCFGSLRVAQDEWNDNLGA